MENLPKVLIGVPTFVGMKYCLDDFLKGLRALDYSNVEILFVDNSDGEEFSEELKAEGFEVLRVGGSSPVEKIVNSRNKIIERALEKDFDFIFMLDADVVCPRDIILELISCEKDIVSGMYFNYFNSSGKLKVLPVVWRSITQEEFNVMKMHVQFPPSVKSHLDLQRHLTLEEADSDELLDVLFPSGGCMLLSRKVFSALKYELPNVNVSNVSDDILFFRRAHERGFGVFCYTKLKCDHLLKGKFKVDEDGNYLHPLNSEYYKKD